MSGPMDTAALEAAINERDQREKAQIDPVALKRHAIRQQIARTINGSSLAKVNNVGARITEMTYSKGTWYAGEIILTTKDGKDPVTANDITIEPMVHRSGWQYGKPNGKWYLLVGNDGSQLRRKAVSTTFGEFNDLTDIANALTYWVCSVRERQLGEIARRKNINAVEQFKMSVQFPTKQRVMDISASTSPEAPFFVKIDLRRSMTEHNLRVLLIAMEGLNLLKD